jgi:hypothetical protein
MSPVAGTTHGLATGEAQLQGLGRVVQRALYEQSLVDMYRQRADEVDPNNIESHRIIALAATGEFTRAIKFVGSAMLLGGPSVPFEVSSHAAQRAVHA